ncbi:carbohydrate ABC transporter permease [Paenibacillus pasadenensis]|uniref:N-Acetyl-D-glucosamine ABC transport system, permease protein n=1 Tax=Paenibacillus pasadenensis TaxID=217090 RepID=A0A2N5N502_9BACL|nr:MULTISPECIES: sugar ABC transporter permease [Paenibacillus]PLT45434.1 N-Acetyl-D-glucosamine ABC transport system, permease protein [Paenibacillus pasadenensis]QGG55921.1 ABC transporter permease subunit [Paenibacillus sp. B01]
MATLRTDRDLTRPKRSSLLQRANVQKWIFLTFAIVPTFGGYLLFALYPNLLSIYYSLLDWNGITEPKFIYFENYVRLFNDRYVWRALGHNLFYMATVPVCVILISLVLSYLLTNKGYKGTSFYKVLFFFPNVLSTVVVSLLWAFIYDGSFGLLNALLKVFGIDMDGFYWLGDTRTAMYAVLPPYVWAGVGLYIVIFMNAMTTIPKSLYEAAILEGAGHMTRLFRITIPLITPLIRVSAIFLVLGTLKSLDLILILTRGGPAGSTDVIGLYMFNMAFGEQVQNYGYASAIGMFLFVILVGAKLLVDKLLPDRGYEY